MILEGLERLNLDDVACGLRLEDGLFLGEGIDAFTGGTRRLLHDHDLVRPASAALDLEQALAKAGSASSIAPANKQILSPQRVKLGFEAVSFNQWLNFAVAMQSTGWPVSVMDVSRGEAGKVKVVAEFGR